MRIDNVTLWEIAHKTLRHEKLQGLYTAGHFIYL